ncbi:hypothetical protein L195_g033557 [Trifolium pratense]|uniref:Uncharacterized protein n=1 Tax=Trifolium pratense TaxID=57577 RepID=A0A2K3LGC6_TRIPR|nr:hypothetical protein L195_g033557 [Trifolium pratense]
MNPSPVSQSEQSFTQELEHDTQQPGNQTIFEEGFEGRLIAMTKHMKLGGIINKGILYSSDGTSLEMDGSGSCLVTYARQIGDSDALYADYGLGSETRDYLSSSG